MKCVKIVCIECGKCLGEYWGKHQEKNLIGGVKYRFCPASDSIHEGMCQSSKNLDDPIEQEIHQEYISKFAS